MALPTAQPGRAIGAAVLYSTAKVAYALQGVGAMRSIDDYRADLNDPEIFGDARRLYLYSRIDDMIPWKDVEGHMIEASGRGYAVTGVGFEDGKHCGLVMGDERRYWDAVERAWEGGKTILGERSRL